MKLENKIAVVTGGAMGNGLGIVKTFLKYGAKVIIIDYSDELDKTVEDLKKDGYEVIGCKADIRDLERLKEIATQVGSVCKHIDVLVNNAGVCKLETFPNMSDEVRDFHFDINIKGTWNVTKVFLPYMGGDKPSSIVNLSSVTGPKVADSGECAYATTKAALIGFTKGLAADLVSQNIRVNAILPGYILTPMVTNMAKLSHPENPQSVLDSIANAIPMKRMGTIEELGELAAFLGSDESSYLTAGEFVIDGGSTLPETMSMGIE